MTQMFDPKKTRTVKVEDTDSIASGTVVDGRKYAGYSFNPKNTSETLAKYLTDNASKELGPVSSWSPSTLKVFESCRYRLYLAKVVKLEDPQSAPAKRGEEIHEFCELYVSGELGEWPETLQKNDKFKHFQKDFDLLRDEFANSNVDLEGEWGFNIDWEITDWRAKDTWARMKLDALLRYSESHVRIIDYKTGKKFGNEITHADQGMIYTVGTLMRYPEIELVDVDFWYLDQAEKSFPKRYTRAQAMTFMPRIVDRALRLTTAKDHQFAPSPSVHNCRICPFNREEHGCEWRVSV